jgi:hypothetical protein
MHAPSKLQVALLATATAAVGSWLLLADPSLGRTPNGQAARKGRVNRVQPNSHGYGGGYSGVCRDGTLRPLSAPEAFVRRGKERCFEGTGNPTGDNADGSTEAFLATDDGVIVNMTKDTRRCVEGTNNGLTCTGYGTCPDGSCQDMTVLACAADARGRSIYFIFDGNPTGQNPDLGDELFAFDTQSRALTQVTVQRGWCTDDPTQACDKSSDCASGGCARARMVGTRASGGYGVLTPGSGLEVSPDGDVVWFVTNGDPGGNPSHQVTQFVLSTQGKAKGLKAVGSAGGFCNSRTMHPGMPCTSALDCGPVCGDGRKDPEEECEPFISTCPTGTFCQFPFRPGECTCVAPVCGNGILEPGEGCDRFTCFNATHCNSDCTGCVLNSPSGAFLDGP